MFGLDDALIGAGVSAFGSLLGGQMRNDAQASQAAQANAFSAQQFATRYQTTVKDMQAAGLSPMLAYAQGGGAPPSGQQGVMNDVVTPAVQSGVSAFQAGNASKLLAAQADAASAQAEAARAQADKTRAETPYVAPSAEADIRLKGSSAELNAAQIGQVNANVDQLRATTDKIKADTNFDVQQDILRQTAWNLRQQGVAAQERGISEGQSRAMMQATINKLVKETGLLNLDLEAAGNLNLGREAGQLKPIIDTIIGVVRAFRR